ncbi:uncharacterized protein LOC130446473 [Diorhabda sublineata]|uniref:uncharacterized protein LOC130446473 n=1 Tax=Diorhabda sublineata TaxID=1163346 RepID=UPI0024E086B3|nr:uncharacterized protein LOC130446473 [Diorhabda sublineata]
MYKVKNFVFCVTLNFLFFISSVISNTDVMPPLFDMDDYSSCNKNETNFFCNVQAKLIVPHANQNIINLIRKFSDDPMTYDRSIVHRALCVPQDKIRTDSTLYAYSNNLVNRNLQKYNLTAEVDDSICVEMKTSYNIYDYLVAIIGIVYLLLVLFATYSEKKQNVKGLERDRKNNFLSNLSLYHTWRKRTTAPTNIDYIKLSNLQGIRFFSMIILILIHVNLFYLFFYISNPIEVERICASKFITPIRWVGTFAVLPFFLFSSWLLTVQVHNIIEKYGELSLKNVGILIINRYARLMFTFVVLLAFIQSSWLINISGPCSFSLLVLNRNSCRRNLLKSILLISNYDYTFDICYPVSWYISADFQLYILNLVILYIKLKFKLKDIKLYFTLLCTSCIIHGVRVYAHSDVIFKPSIRAMEERYLRYSSLYMVQYMSTLSIWSSSVIGVILGDIYNKTKNITIKNTWPLTLLWASIFLFLPLLTMYIHYVDMRGLKAVILTCLSKPLYNLGIGVGIYGMSHNIGGIVKNLLESKYVVILSNFTYCVYLVHIGIIIAINKHISSNMEVTIGKLIWDCIISISLSFICSVFITLIIEEPGEALQKKYLPQISKWKKKSNN